MKAEREVRKAILDSVESHHQPEAKPKPEAKVESKAEVKFEAIAKTESKPDEPEPEKQGTNDHGT